MQCKIPILMIYRFMVNFVGSNSTRSKYLFLLLKPTVILQQFMSCLVGSLFCHCEGESPKQSSFSTVGSTFMSVFFRTFGRKWNLSLRGGKPEAIQLFNGREWIDYPKPNMDTQGLYLDLLFSNFYKIVKY